MVVVVLLVDADTSPFCWLRPVVSDVVVVGMLLLLLLALLLLFFLFIAQNCGVCAGGTARSVSAGAAGERLPAGVVVVVMVLLLLLLLLPLLLVFFLRVRKTCGPDG